VVAVVTVQCNRCGAVLPNDREMVLHLVSMPHKPRVYIQPPVGTLVCVPDGGAAAVIGRIVRHDEDQCVVANQDDPSYEVWAYVEASDIVKEN
jgi:ribosomal protein S27E